MSQDASKYKPVSGVLDTPEVAAPKQTADKHRATITGVKLVTFSNEETGATTSAFKIGLHSNDRNFDVDYSLFIPSEFAADIHLDPTTLSDVATDGKKMSPRANYGMRVANARGTAELQVLRKIAQEAGNFDTVDVASTVLNGRTAPETIEDFAKLYDKILTGVDVVFFRKPRKSEDPRYDGQLEVRGVAPIEAAVNPNKLKNYHAAWETGV